MTEKVAETDRSQPTAMRACKFVYASEHAYHDMM